jgi:glutamyl-tRNA synthetase
MHLGNARAALFNALYGTKNKGTFILRIEDTDVTRGEDRYVVALEDDLHWLGIKWQEGPEVGGKYGPYWQSQRQDIYKKYYKILEENKKIYPCFCTDQMLNMARKLQLSRNLPPRYSGTCLHLTQDEINERLSKGEKPSWRFHVVADQSIEFVDAVKGPQCFLSNDIGDFIVRRQDGTAPFLFCNAIDDATMKVTHVLRGEDHLANTPRQIMILKTLGETPPIYGHLSLILGDDGAPLSKRHGSFSITDLRQKGFLPQAIVNYLARLGHTCDAQALLNFEDLAEHFYLEKLSKSPAKFDESQLMYWQKIAVQALDANEMWRWLGETVMGQVPEKFKALFAETIQKNIQFPDDALIWAKIFFHDKVFIDEKGSRIIREAGEQFFVEAELAVDKYGIQLERVLSDMKQTLSISGKHLFMPLRVALTGKTDGPELQQVATLLGQEKMKHRLSFAFKLVGQNN